jgi:outer membrane protein OmpA-like peptidoglycan-associated protein
MGILKKGEDKKKLAFNNLMTAVSGMNPNKIKHLTEDDLNDPEPLSLSEGREKKEEEVKESSEPDKKEDQEVPARSEAEEKKEQLSSSKENPFSYENIIRKSNTEDGKFSTFKLKRETLDMLDAIARGSEKNVSKSTIIHNLVSTFLNENLEKLKSVAAKKIKKDYLK